MTWCYLPETDCPSAREPVALICSVDGCDRKHLAKGFCQAHYERLKRHGDPLSGRVYPGATAQFIEQALASETDDCILWPFAKDGGGYGKISRQGAILSVPVEVLEKSGKPKPSPKHVAAHAPAVCHEPACINPRHLRWATPSENMADRLIDGTANRGSKHGNARLTETDIPEIRRDLRTSQDIARHYEVSEATIRDVRAGRTWVHVK